MHIFKSIDNLISCFKEGFEIDSPPLFREKGFKSTTLKRGLIQFEGALLADVII